MAKIIDVKNINDALNLKCRQLSVPLEDEKCIILELCDICQFCDGYEDKCQDWSEDEFSERYGLLSEEESLSASEVALKTLLTSLSQVSCVGCRRSCERLINELKASGGLSLDPLVISKSGFLSVQFNSSTHCETLNRLFSLHGTPLSEILDSIPKYKKTGRCMLHSMDGVRYRASSHIWLEVWEGLSDKCRDALSVIKCEKMVVALDAYLLKHRFCHECKNKVHRAYDILVGNRKIDPSKEKGYAPSLYNGITKCSKGHLHVKAETDFIVSLMNRAEQEQEGRRERHAKTMEIAQEEVLTCIGTFIYERLHKVYSSMKEEAQAFHILFHLGIDVLRRNFELALEEKQGFSKFEQFCEELQRQEMKQKLKKEKRKKKKKNEEMKPKKSNSKEQSRSDSEVSSSPAKSISKSPKLKKTKPLRKDHFENVPRETVSDEAPDDSWQVVGRVSGSARKSKVADTRKGSDVLPEPPKDLNSNHAPSRLRSSDLKGSTSVDSLTSRCSQCSRDGGYCSAACSNSSSCNSSDVACGDAFCAHAEELDIPPEPVPPQEVISEPSCSERNCHSGCEGGPTSCRRVQCQSLQEMLNDFSCECEEIPEAEVKAWRARLGSVRQMRAELRQKLLQRFHQLCIKKV